jgi:hypothetical protein
MNFRDRLKSPTALAVQGFFAGGLLFFSLHPLASGPRELPPQSGEMAFTIPA